jgi:hypothetical protein
MFSNTTLSKIKQVIRACAGTGVKNRHDAVRLQTGTNFLAASSETDAHSSRLCLGL